MKKTSGQIRYDFRNMLQFLVDSSNNKLDLGINLICEYSNKKLLQRKLSLITFMCGSLPVFLILKNEASIYG